MVDTAAGQPPAARADTADQTEPTTTDEEFQADLSETIALYFHEYDPAYADALMSRTIVNGQVGMWSMQQLVAWGVQESLPEITVPTLVLVGREDRVCPLGASEEIVRGISHAQLTVVDNSGHFPWIEAPDEFSAAIRTWLGTVT